MGVELIQGDCLTVMQTLPECSVDSIVTDPPYGLSFMGKDWDHGVPCVAFWVEALRVAKPGAHLLAFGGTRTFHRLAVAIEDAGWEIRDTIMWVYGSGFPKSLNIGKAIDKMQGNEREFIGYGKRNPRDKKVYAGNSVSTFAENKIEALRQTKGYSQWEGWGTALKPAYEPVLVARKPIKSTVAANVLEYGTGGLNIDATRIVSDDVHKVAYSNDDNDRERTGDQYSHTQNKLHSVGDLSQCEHCKSLLSSALEYETKHQQPQGSLVDCLPYHHCDDVPVHLFSEDAQASAPQLHDEHEPLYHCTTEQNNRDCLSTCEPPFFDNNDTTPHIKSQGRWPANLIHDGSDEVLGLFPESNGDSPNRKQRKANLNNFGFYVQDKHGNGIKSNGFVDSGSAARFFYCAKASKADRDEGLDGMPLGEPPASARSKPAEGRQNPLGNPRANHHPTVKPTALMRYLCKLVTPPGGVVLDPFMGSGSTGKAAKMEGFSFIGIELEQDYIEIAQRRIDAAKVEVAQPTLFEGA